jgi:hypothetical protein
MSTLMDRDWHSRMSKSEYQWCMDKICVQVPGYPVCVAEERAAQVWKGSQFCKCMKSLDPGKVPEGGA